MKNVLVTGSKGFIGKHMVEKLKRVGGFEVAESTRLDAPSEFQRRLDTADAIVHLAGVNRPDDAAEFETVNAELTSAMCAHLEHAGRQPLIVFSSSSQADLDNPYGRSKRKAEQVIQAFTASTGAPSVIFRLKNVFGKWCRPNYNSVVATFCHGVAHELPLTISDPVREVELVYIDDVVAAFLDALRNPPGQGSSRLREVEGSARITLDELATRIRSFREQRDTLLLPRFDDEFTQRLYATYLSYLDPKDFSYRLRQREDARGTLAELLKSEPFGQVYVSRTRPGATRGNHFHHTKVEKFFVIEGEALIRFRRLDAEELIEYRVAGRDFAVVDIPPGYAHSIENVGSSELIVLFWSSQIFDPGLPDTFSEPVQHPMEA